MLLTLTNVTYCYEDSPVIALPPLSASFPVGWTCVVGANGSGKSTLLRLAVGELLPLGGTIHSPAPGVYCAQPTDEPPPAADDFAVDWAADAMRLRAILGIQDDWLWRWDTLSHGERKRLQIAVALWQRPRILAVDEPTNHLDAPARELVASALATHDGIGLLVSHDRDLMDSLSTQCLFLGAGGAVMRPGSYSAGRAQEELERETAARERETAKRDLSRLHGEAADRRTDADRAHALRSRRHLDRHDSDGRARIGAAIISGKDGQAGRLSAQLDGRMRRAQERLDGTRVEKLPAGDIWIPGERSRRAVVAAIGPGTIPLGPERELVIPALTVGASDRIAIIGPNGMGKSTLVRTLLASTPLEAGRVLAIPQEISVAESATVLAALKGLPEARLGEVLAIVARLGSPPERVLGGGATSPGELRKIMVALGVLGSPHLIVMDEPTNHLDILSVEALEEALAGCPCALVLVSHDARFVEHLTTMRWTLVEERGATRVQVW